MALIADDPAVLVIVYRRHQNLKEILNLCVNNAVSRIYVALDGPKDGNNQGLSDYNQAISVILEFEQSFTGMFKYIIRDTNVGCAPSVLAACDWVFRDEQSAIILEDDCIPLNSFFDFSRKSMRYIDYNKNIWLSCGTQFVPSVHFEDSWALSKYPLNWGWATSKAKWVEMRDCILSPKCFSPVKRFTIEGSYWEAGLRRARDGWVDAWDIILAHQMLLHEKFAILPSSSLISNIGNDHVATNAKDSASNLTSELREFYEPVSHPVYSKLVERELRKKVFKIRPRHLISTRIMHFWDLLNRGNNSLGSLETRVRQLLVTSPD